MAPLTSELDRGGAQVRHAQQRVLATDPAPSSAAPAGAAERHVDVPPAGAGVDNYLTHREFLNESVGLADVSCATRRSAISPAKRGEIGGISLDLMANLDSKE